MFDVSTGGVLFAFVVTVLAGAFAYLLFRKQAESKGAAALKDAVEKNLHVPPSLHPIIDPNICIGSLSCIKVCPEGDILGVIDNKAVLIEGSNCIGHGQCALECPVDAIKLVFGTAERGLDLPEIDEFFESSRPGVHIVGELGGMGLIKNAVRQGVQVATRLKKILPPPKDREIVDVAVVGAGPAGLSAALAMKQQGLSFRIVDQESLGGTIANYPRQKIVMIEPIEIPFFGKISKREISKERLLEVFEAAVKAAEIKVFSGVKVTGLQGEDGNFSLLTSKGAIRARKIVLAAGRRGSPRKLGVPGEELSKVTYRLIDPAQYEGRRVLVVGGGDSALEAAIMLAGETKTEVSISYRESAFGRCRPANREKIEALIASQRIRPFLPSAVTAIGPAKVALTVKGSPTEIPNDFVIVCIGGELPLEFLKTAGVAVKRHFGTGPERKAAAAAPSGGQVSRIVKDDLAGDRARRRTTRIYAAFGAVIVLVLLAVGGRYYFLPLVERVRAPGHAFLRPAGLWGHGVGIAATLFMLSNFLYPMRKRLGWLKGRSFIRKWLTFHMFVGFMSPLVILFHAAFQSNNVLATSTFLGLMIVVGTGVVGRFIFSLVPAAGDRHMDLAELRSQFEQHRGVVQPLLASAENPQALKALIRWIVAAEAKSASLIGLFVTWPFEYARLRIGLARVRLSLHNHAFYADFRDEMFRLVRLRRQIRIFNRIRTILSIWRVFHVVLALFLIVLIAVHIYISVDFGYRWIF